MTMRDDKTIFEIKDLGPKEDLPDPLGELASPSYWTEYLTEKAHSIVEAHHAAGEANSYRRNSDPWGPRNLNEQVRLYREQAQRQAKEAQRLLQEQMKAYFASHSIQWAPSTSAQADISKLIAGFHTHVQSVTPAGPPHVELTKLQMAEILEAAAAYMRTHGWTQGHMWDDRGQVCGMGAIAMAVQASGINGSRSVIQSEVCRVTGLKTGIPTFNDAPGRTQEEVEALLLDAARFLRKEYDAELLEGA